MGQAARDRRDPLTGNRILPDTLVMRFEVPAHPLPRAHYTDPLPDLIVAPLRLHTSQTEGVGLAYSSLLQRYLAAYEWNERETRRAEEIRADQCWWESEYGVQLVRKRLLEWHELRTVLRILEVVTTLHEEHLSIEDAAERYQRTSWWVRTQYHKCNRLANSHRRACTCVYCEQDRARYPGKRAS